jgi:plasmid stabilization system protein ParE
MSLPIRLLPEARDEFDAAVDWYEQQRPGLGSAFLDPVRDVFGRIAANPQLHGIVYQDVRKAVVRKFPYVVLYKEEAGEVIVIAVFHSKRDPTIWQGRV